MQPTGFDNFGALYDLPLTPGSEEVNVIIHRREDKDQEVAVNVPAVATGRSVGWCMMMTC
jgi:hypothetical protein